MKNRVDQQIHGYRDGHQLLSSTIRLAREDQDAVDRLSDLSGPLAPGEQFKPYLTTYPLPGLTHYAVARTWQDVSAPRAGCVLTRTLLVPMNYWEETESIASLLPLLKPVESDSIEPLLPAPADTFPIVVDPQLLELVEALFFEIRIPTVFFDARDPDVIAGRLLTAIWPALRRNFAICTFSLSPRKLQGRDFDLLFAPGSARGRFGNWSGRRVGNSRAAGPRHRWSASTREQIFERSEPRLLESDQLGVLRNDERGDEAALRLALLWNELSSKAPTTPTAVLGLLDILKSQQINHGINFAAIEPLIQNAINLATHTFAPTDAWDFISTLLHKFDHDSDLPDGARRALIAGCADLTKRQPNQSIEFLIRTSDVPLGGYDALCAGIADGLSEAGAQIVPSLAELAPVIFARLLTTSNRFIQWTVAWIHGYGGPLTGTFSSALGFLSSDTLTKIRLSLKGLLDKPNIGPILRPLLDGATTEEFSEILEEIGKHTGFRYEEIDEPLVAVATDRGFLEALWKIASKFDDDEAENFLVRALGSSPNGFRFLRNIEDQQKRYRLLLLALRRPSNNELQRILSDDVARDDIFSMLIGALPSSASVMASILDAAHVNDAAYIEYGLKIAPFLKLVDNTVFFTGLLARLFSYSDANDDDLSQIINLVCPTLGARQWIQLATQRSAAGGTIARNVVLVQRSSRTVREAAESEIEYFSERLIDSGASWTRRDANAAWALLVGEAVHSDKKFAACSAILAFALNSTDKPVEPLIEVSFPVVFRELLQSGEQDQYSIPAFFRLPLAFFVDWDRAKSARNNLVDAYLRSSWEPISLLRVVSECGVVPQAVERLSQTHGGREYFQKILKQAQNSLDLPPRVISDLHHFDSY